MVVLTVFALSIDDISLERGKFLSTRNDMQKLATVCLVHYQNGLTYWDRKFEITMCFLRYDILVQQHQKQTNLFLGGSAIFGCVLVLFLETMHLVELKSSFITFIHVQLVFLSFPWHLCLLLNKRGCFLPLLHHVYCSTLFNFYGFVYSFS